MNHTVLAAVIAEQAALRYTPAGVPALDLRLDHESTVEEAGAVRTVTLSIKALAIGTVAERLSQVALGTRWRFAGFLAGSRQRKGVVLHIQEFQQD